MSSKGGSGSLYLSLACYPVRKHKFYQWLGRSHLIIPNCYQVRFPLPSFTCFCSKWNHKDDTASRHMSLVLLSWNTRKMDDILHEWDELSIVFSFYCLIYLPLTFPYHFRFSIMILMLGANRWIFAMFFFWVRLWRALSYPWYFFYLYSISCVA